MQSVSRVLSRSVTRRQLVGRTPTSFPRYTPSTTTHAFHRRLASTQSQPGPTISDHAMRLLDYSGTVAFASTGAIAAAVAGMDSLGCTVVGTITAVGGGTIRDMILSRAAFWTLETEYLWLCLASAGAGFVWWKRVVEEHADTEKERAQQLLDGFGMMLWDAFGVGAFAVIGAKNGKRAGKSPIICLVCGMMTATFGGVTRDVLTQQPPRILHSHAELYATTALSGAAVYLMVGSLGGGQILRNGLGVLTTVGFRAYAWEHDLKLPIVEVEESGTSGAVGGDLTRRKSQAF